MALWLEQIPFLAGILLAWSLAAPPGPANAIMAHVAADRGVMPGWFAGLGAVTGDALMFALMGVGVLPFYAHFPIMPVVLGGIGAVLMAYFAWGAYRSATKSVGAASSRAGFVRSFSAIIVSPFNWAWWLTVGTALYASLGWWLVAGFFVGLIGWCGAWSWLMRFGTTRVRGLRTSIGYVASGLLLVFAGVLGTFAVMRALELAA